MRTFAEDALGKFAEALLPHVGLGRDRADQAADELDIAVDAALQARAYRVEFVRDLGAQTRFENDPVLIVGENPGNQNHQGRDQGWDVIGRQKPREPVFPKILTFYFWHKTTLRMRNWWQDSPNIPNSP